MQPGCIELRDKELRTSPPPRTIPKKTCKEDRKKRWQVLIGCGQMDNLPSKLHMCEECLHLVQCTGAASLIPDPSQPLYKVAKGRHREKGRESIRVSAGSYVSLVLLGRGCIYLDPWCVPHFSLCGWSQTFKYLGGGDLCVPDRLDQHSPELLNRLSKVNTSCCPVRHIFNS